MWQDRAEYAGLLLTGSYATNTFDEGSDVDFRIVFKRDVTQTEVGECHINGKCISFVGMSSTNYIRLFEDDLKTTSRFEIRRFLVGKVIQDNDGSVENLKEKAKGFFDQEMSGFLPVEELGQLLEIGRAYKVFMEMFEDDVFLPIAYYQLLAEIFNCYSKCLKADIPVFPKKWSRYFEEASYRNVHFFEPFPDQKFVSLFQIACKKLDREALTSLYFYFKSATGGYPDTDFLAQFDHDTQQARLYAFSEV